MEIKIQKKFLKELAKIPKKERQKIEDFVFEESAVMNSLEEAGEINVCARRPGND